MMGVVKSNAYSLGLLPVSRILVEEGCTFLAVATVDEALELRRNFPDVSVLVMGPTPVSAAGAIVENNIVCACADLRLAGALAQASSGAGKKARIHVKVDTGLGRNGFLPEEAGSAVRAIHGLGIVPEGIFSHFAVADDENLDYTYWQFERFQAVIEDLAKQGFTFPMKHICNSSALIRCPEMHLDAVRPGNILYGCPDRTAKTPFELLPTVSVKTAIVSIRRLPARTAVSYGLSYVTRGEIPVSVLPIGYGDGFVRNMPDPQALVRGKRVPVIGRICMDQTVIDLSGVPDAAPGDEVVLIGRQGDEEISLAEITAKMNTVAGQVLNYFTARLPRVYIHTDSK